MSEDSKPHPLNVEGPFYVTDGCCLACGIPEHVAPELFKWSESESCCYVSRQPENSAELGKMCEVLELQDIMCIRCRSRDQSLLAELTARGLEDFCDYTSED